ncbi:Eco57I restriction-modification methylase domain-containing protein [Tenacibaculum discolor]|uniref:Eco57I restriction-modification methylase domain-containing protein n=1 Tax=Tenacibaculum discolor TaxID=361581 RepID=UPI001F4A0272|nr:N-6 DNA methylase [Tenacibaculum discolor]
MNKKNTGSYYTPSYLAGFISRRVLSHFEGRTRVSIIEPSVGDGAFVEELVRENRINIQLTALDINNEALVKASEKWRNQQKDFINIDFLEYQNLRRYSAVIGNPPYVKKNVLTERQIRLSKELHLQAGLTETSVKNIWATFLVKSVELLVNNGMLAFVLPSELLQVKFAEEIRKYLRSKFRRLEFFTFNDLMFECKGQDTVVLFGYKEHETPGEYIVNIEGKEDLLNDYFEFRNIGDFRQVKPIHGSVLTSSEIDFIENLRNRLKKINHYSESKPGIVTAANKFFIIDQEKETKFDLKVYTRPIIQKGFYVNGSVVFDNSSFERMESSNYPTKLLTLDEETIVTPQLEKYLKIGIKDKIPERYKCKIRNKWYVIPNVSTAPDAFFFKRSHLYPKLLKNTSKAYVTDSAYKVSMREGFDLNSFIYSFYNTLTLLFSELDGRYYGGGVLELTPNEFKNLPLPYVEIEESKFKNYSDFFEKKASIEEVLKQNDDFILKEGLGLTKKEVLELRNIREKLKKKRMRK